MQNELMHYGVKGMKWGVRRKRDSTPKTNWGKNRQYAKEQDRLNKEMWKSTKAKVKSGTLSKKSAQYKRERARYDLYNNEKKYGAQMGMTKAARGKYMQKAKISAKQPVSSLKTSKYVKLQAEVAAKQAGKMVLTSIAARAAINLGAAYLQSRIDFNIADKLNTTPRLPKGDMINVKRYKVY